VYLSAYAEDRDECEEDNPPKPCAWEGMLQRIPPKNMEVPRALPAGLHEKRGELMKKILVVDDEESIRFLYTEELEEDGFSVEVAKNGEEALEKLSIFKPDLITLDIKMPGMDGIETLKRIRELNRKLPIIMCSAYGEYKQDLTTWASDAYIVKCADLTELKTTIRRLLGLS
jgi:CheY-like chemotaxis protein